MCDGMLISNTSALFKDYISPTAPEILWHSFKAYDLVVTASALVVNLLTLMVIVSTSLLTLEIHSMRHESIPYQTTSRFVLDIAMHVENWTYVWPQCLEESSTIDTPAENIDIFVSNGDCTAFPLLNTTTATPVQMVLSPSLTLHPARLEYRPIRTFTPPSALVGRDNQDRQALSRTSKVATRLCHKRPSTFSSQASGFASQSQHPQKVRSSSITRLCDSENCHRSPLMRNTINSLSMTRLLRLFAMHSPISSNQ